MDAILSRDAGPRILKAMGLPAKGCAGVVIEIAPNAVVTATVEYIVTEETIQALEEMAPQLLVQLKSSDPVGS